MWSQPSARGLAAAPELSQSPAARVDAVLGSGLRTPSGRVVLTPYGSESLVEGSECVSRPGRLVPGKQDRSMTDPDNCNL